VLQSHELEHILGRAAAFRLVHPHAMACELVGFEEPNLGSPSRPLWAVCTQQTVVLRPYCCPLAFARSQVLSFLAKSSRSNSGTSTSLLPHGYDRRCRIPRGLLTLAASPRNFNAPSQAGLETILAPLRARNATDAELKEVTAQAHAYYASQKAAPELSFDEVARRIANNEPVPGIRSIPDELNVHEPSEAVLAKREVKKPWES
jgi:hypothetical protein